MLLFSFLFFLFGVRSSRKRARKVLTRYLFLWFKSQKKPAGAVPQPTDDRRVEKKKGKKKQRKKRKKCKNESKISLLFYSYVSASRSLAPRYVCRAIKTINQKKAREARFDHLRQKKKRARLYYYKKKAQLYILQSSVLCAFTRTEETAAAAAAAAGKAFIHPRRSPDRQLLNNK